MSLRDLNGWVSGTKLEVLVDYQNVKHNTNRDLISCALSTLGFPTPIGGPTGSPPENLRPYTDAGVYDLHSTSESDLRSLDIKLTRIENFAGMYWVHGIGNTINPEEFAGCLDKAVHYINRLGTTAKSLIVSPYKNSLQFPLPLTDHTLLASVAERMKNYNGSLLEVVSEPFRQALGLDSYFSTPAAYASYHEQAFAAVKSIYAGARVGLNLLYRMTTTGSNYSEQYPQWGTEMASNLYGYYNFITAQLFGQEPGSTSASPWPHGTILGTQAIRLLEWADALQPFAPVIVTSYGLAPIDSTTPGGNPELDPRGSNILGALFRAHMMILALDDSDLLGMLGTAAITQGTNPLRPGFLTLNYTSPGWKTYLFWLYRYMRMFVGEQILSTIGKTVIYEDSTSSVPGIHPQAVRRCSLLPVLASKTEDERNLLLVVANLDTDSSHNVEIRVTNFDPVQPTAYILASQSTSPFDELGWLSPDTIPVSPFAVELDDKVLSFTIPKHSIVFIRLQQRTPWKDVLAANRYALLQAQNPPVGASSAYLYIGRYPEEVFATPPVAMVHAPNWQTEWTFDKWGLNYYGFEYNVNPPVFEGPHPVWDEASFWPIRAAEIVYNELLRHTEALSNVGAPHDTDPVVVHFGLGRSLQPPYIAVSVPSVTYEPLGFPLVKWGTSFVEIEICTKLGGISQPYTYHNTLVSAVVDILNRLLSARTSDTAFFADRIDLAGPVSDVEDSENVVLTSFVTMIVNVIYDGANK